MDNHRQQIQQQARPAERESTHGANRRPTPQQPSAFPSFPPPPVSQAPVHIPFSADPFSRHDPFMSSNNHTRHDGQSHQSRDRGTSTPGERGGWANASVGHHLHSSPPAGANVADFMSHPFDTARRRSLGAGPVPHQHAGPLDRPRPPPSHSLAGRIMLPPSPSQQSNASNASNAFSNPLSRAPPPPSSFGTARDLAALNAAHRPGSSMSISSMLGSDSSAPHHLPMAPSVAAASTLANSARPMQPPSPRRRPSSTFGQYGASTSPEKLYNSNGSKSEGTISAGANSPGRASGTKSHSPELVRLQHSSLSQNSAALGFRSFQPSTGEMHDRSESRLPSESIPPRPNSQPSGPREPAFSPPKPGRHDGKISRIFHDVTYQSRNLRVQEGQNRNLGHLDFRETPSNPTTPRDRSNTIPSTSQSAISPLRDRIIAPTDLREILHTRPQPQEWNATTLEKGDQIPGEHASDILRPNPPSQALNSRFPPADPRSSADLRQFRPLDGFNERLDSGSFGPARSPERITNPHSQTAILNSGPYLQHRAPLFENRIPLAEDSSQQQRTLLGVSPELNRSRARGSPLPQAVQGAQPNRSGPGDGPAVKHEFGRMFSGLGSGVGSNTPIAGMTANGNMTPGRQTPTRALDETERVNPSIDAEPEGANLVREAFRGARRGRKIKDEDRMGSDSGESRGTPAFSGRRGSKRAKTNHPTHHFHVTAHGHHHHHAPHPDEEVSFTGSTASLPHSHTPLNPLKFNSPYQTQPMFSTPSQPHHHHGHHHHHAPPHHHHHPPKAHNPVSLQARKPQTRVYSQPIIHSVAHLPRKHLGSALYSPRVSVPAVTTSSVIDLKHGFTSRPRPIPRFDGQANCTFTIRIPRYFLKPAQREAVCGSRCLWGTDVYTDDSDPLAACIHSGWIRGEWGEDVDTDLLFEDRFNSNGIEGDGGDGEGDSADVLFEPPKAGPVLPPVGRDLHITLLLLPPLEGYASTTSWGIRSRGWAGNHDGMSFKVLRVEWVDEGTGKGEEKSAEGRRKRLRGRTRLMREMKLGSREEGKVVEGVA